MATPADPFKNLQDELTCCLCLDYFKHPVSVKKCSHNFCKECIMQHCKKKGSKASCPTCRQALGQNNLAENRSLANIVEIIQQINENASARGREPENCWELSELFCRDGKETSGSQSLKLSAGHLLSQLKHPRPAQRGRAGPWDAALLLRLLRGASLRAGRGPWLPRVAAGAWPCDWQCSICLELLARPATLPCGHSFCLACLRGWAEAKAREGRRRSCPHCQRTPPKRLPDRNVLLEWLLEQYRSAASGGAPPPAGPSLAAPFAPEPAAAKRRTQDEVKISEIPAQITVVWDAVFNMRKDRTEMKGYMSRIKTSITEDFTVMKKHINEQEQMVLEVLDQECGVAEQKVDAVVDLLTARINKLLELQDNSEELLKNASPEQVYVGSSTAVDEVTLDVQKIDSIAHAVKKLRRSLEVPLLGNYPKQMLQEPSPGPSSTSEILAEVGEFTVASSSNYSQLQDTHRDTSECPSSVACDRDSSVPMISSHFSPWASDVTFDLERIQNNLGLTKNKRRVTVSPYPCNYEPSPKRFRTSQVMGSPGFSEGCHYWEVSTKDSTGWAIGVAVREIGSRDQLGRTELSWCLEWSNEKLSAWHNGQETQISEEKPLRVGTFLKIPEKSLSFYSCSDKETWLHNFKIKTNSPVYPAFWIYGGQVGDFLTICNIERS